MSRPLPPDGMLPDVDFLTLASATVVVVLFLVICSLDWAAMGMSSDRQVKMTAGKSAIRFNMGNLSDR